MTRSCQGARSFCSCSVIHGTVKAHVKDPPIFDFQADVVLYNGYLTGSYIFNSKHMFLV